MTIKQVLFASRELAESFAGNPYMAVISITDPTTPPAKLHPLFQHVLRLSFFDAIPGDEFMPAPPGLFDMNIARQISEFVQTLHQAPFEITVMVHCEYGVSRSAAVALFVEAFSGAPLSAREFTYEANEWVVSRLQLLHPELRIEIPPANAAMIVANSNAHANPWRHAMHDSQETRYLNNTTYDEIQIGSHASLTRTLRPEDVKLFSVLTGDVNPSMLDAEYSQSSMFREVIAHGMWSGSLISTVLGSQYPGPGTILVDQTLHFARPVTIGDTITITVTAKQKFDHNKHVIFDCVCTNQENLQVVRGTAEILAPTEKVSRLEQVHMPEVHIDDKHARYQHMLDLVKGLEPIPIAVAHPCDKESLKGPVQAFQQGIIEPILVGPESKIRAVAEEFGIDLHGIRIVNAAHSHDSAALAVSLVRTGDAEALMKGSLHTDELMSEVVSRTSGLRTSRRISHVFLMDVPTYHRPLLITDAAINIAPTLEDKVHIIQNAIDVAHVIGIPEPKVAILSAVETVNPKIQSTLDAAALCKMADRGQIKGGLLDGPLAFDNAVSIVAAKTKGIQSAVAGHAEILVVPDLESGNMVAKQLEYLANALAAGVVVGAKVPIVLTSRADTAETRIMSCVIAALIAHANRKKGIA